MGERTLRIEAALAKTSFMRVITNSLILTWLCLGETKLMITPQAN